jgi:Transposase DDE domain
VLAGNTAEARTPVDNLHHWHQVVTQVAPDAPFPLVISDRAMLSLATLAAYEASGVRYLGPLPDSDLTSVLLERAASTDWAAHPLADRPARDQRWRHVPPTQGTAANVQDISPAEAGVYYGVRRRVDLPLPAVGTTPARPRRRPALVVKRTRQATLDATHRQALLTRREASLSDLAGKLNRGRYRRRAAVEARLAILLAAPGTARVRRFLSVRLDGADDDLSLIVAHDSATLAHAAPHDGLYVLVTTDDDLDDAQILARTKGRDRVEKRIGVCKGPLAVRPMFLEKVERIRAMIFICLVALLIYTLLEQRARQAGLHLTGRKVLERFAVCNAVLTTFAQGASLLLAVPYSAWQQEVALALALPDPNQWLVPLDPLPTERDESRLSVSEMVRTTCKEKLQPTAAHERELERVLLLCRRRYHGAREQRSSAWQRGQVSTRALCAAGSRAAGHPCADAGVRGQPCAPPPGGAGPPRQDLSGVLSPGAARRAGGLPALPGAQPLPLLHLQGVWQWHPPRPRLPGVVQDRAHCGPVVASAGRHAQDGDAQPSGGRLVRRPVLCGGARAPAPAHGCDHRH